jgi:hypothetical protein
MKSILCWTYCLIVILACSFFSCKDNDSVVNNSGGSVSVTNLTGKVSNWIMGDSVTVIAGIFLDLYGRGDSLFIFGSNRVSTDGSFSVNLSTPPQEILRGFGNGNYTFSDSSATFCTMLGLTLRYPNGTFDPKKIHNACEPYSVFKSDSSNIGDYYAYFMYSDRNVIMLGTDSGGTIVHNNLQLKKGWNRILWKIASRQVNVIVMDGVVDNNVSGNWYHEW